MVKLHDLEFEPYISEEEITRAIERISEELNEEYAGQKPVFIGVLNGSFMFASEIIKRFKSDCEVSFVKMGSYEGTQTTGNVKTLVGLNQDLKGRQVVLLEDIVDTGNTLVEIDQILRKAGVAGYKVATLFYKPEAYKKDIPVQIKGIEIPNKFIVGFGLDYDGLGRNLTQVYKRKEKTMTNLVLFGPPGAGKGTQATILKDKYNLIHISTGDVFRFNIKNQTPLGLSAKSYIDKGQLVPDEVTINMLNAEVEKNEGANGFIFDGFPRTEAQAEALSKYLESKGTEVHAMIALEVEDEILVERLLERGKTSGRPDDADETVIRNRIKVYYNETAILKNYYQKQDKYYGVDGVGSIKEITERLSDVIDELMK
ncbi:adenylate kinase [Christiangramia sabulilitoris]|uniref:Adenylate kinase n=1 Tax=Christiangramia sabulilitoris TaxID=2583991 RepID=A0A550I418_9FLAO|nr:adenylate kinase [Christiangramia sabulilitoris]TRO65717.1 adenylate kinase [Christiangramia sabulilitoris]